MTAATVIDDGANREEPGDDLRFGSERTFMWGDREVDLCPRLLGIVLKEEQITENSPEAKARVVNERLEALTERLLKDLKERTLTVTEGELFVQSYVEYAEAVGARYGERAKNLSQWILSRSELVHHQILQAIENAKSDGIEGAPAMTFDSVMKELGLQVRHKTRYPESDAHFVTIDLGYLDIDDKLTPATGFGATKELAIADIAVKISAKQLFVKGRQDPYVSIQLPEVTAE